MSQYPPPSSNRWESSGKPPIRQVDSRKTSASARERSRPTSAAGADDYLSSDTDSNDANLSLSITKLPPIDRSSKLYSSSSSRIYSSLSQTVSSKSSIASHSRPQSSKKIQSGESMITIKYKESVGIALNERHDLQQQAQQGQADEPTTKPEVLLKSNDIELSENIQKPPKKSSQILGDRKAKPTWGAKPGEKLVSKLGKSQSKLKTASSVAPKKVAPEKPLKSLETKKSSNSTNDKTNKKRKVSKKIAKSEQEGIPIIQIPTQEYLLKQQQIEGGEEYLNHLKPENSHDDSSIVDSVDESNHTKSSNSISSENESHSSDSDSSSEESSSESSSSSESESKEKEKDTETPLDIPSVLPEMNLIDDEIFQLPLLAAENDTAKQDKVIEKREALEEYLQKSNPLTRLNLSQYNLFSNTAGAFRGPGDVYYKFILGGKSVRPGAKRMKKVKIQEVELGKLDEILVEKAKHQTTLWNHKSVSKLREKHKEYLNDSITTKVINLEQTRAYIITTIHSINSFKKLLLQLTDMNEKLRDEHKEVIALSNKKVSDTLAKNEDFVEKILKLEKEKILERKRAVKELADYMKICDNHTSELERQLDQKQNALNAKLHDMQDLKEFERASFEDPAITEKRLAREVESKQLKLKSLEDDVQYVKKKFPDLVSEFDGIMQERGSAIFEASLLKFKKYVANVSQKLKDQNLKFKNEIQHQETISSSIEKEIEELKAKAITMKSEADRQTDARRNVLNLKDYMTCEPNMDVKIHTGI